MPEAVRVGIADDDETVRLALRRALATSPDLHVVSVVGDGEAAVALARSGRIDVLVLDLEMPVMTGREALKLIRVLAPDVRVVVHSGQPASKCETGMLDAGATAYVHKPCDLGRMIDVLREAAKSVPRLRAR